MEKLQQDFLELDVGSLCEIFRLKSEQEEVSDFSFSFGQTDICEGLVSWVSHDLDNRQEWGELSCRYSYLVSSRM
jgi:hypothetical protein